MTSGGREVDELLNLLARAGRLAGQSRVVLRVDADNLETVYLEADAESVIAHDRGETFYYLAVTAAGSGDTTYRPWSKAVAGSALTGSPVTLVDESDSHSQAFRLVLPIVGDMSVRAAVSAMSTAIDRIFHEHLVDESRDQGWTD
jgi:hypothetical protein